LVVGDRGGSPEKTNASIDRNRSADRILAASMARREVTRIAAPPGAKLEVVGW
jgi:hypothetical protein